MSNSNVKSFQKFEKQTLDKNKMSKLVGGTTRNDIVED